jgi:hypothetical protein
VRQRVPTHGIGKSRNAKTRKNLESKGGPKVINPFSSFRQPRFGRDKDPGRARMKESRNPKTGKACWFRIEESTEN